jgi:replicative DNA helicase
MLLKHQGKFMIDSGETERYLISSVLKTTDEVQKQIAIDSISLGMIGSAKNRSLWEAIKSLSDEGHLVDLPAMYGRLPNEIAYISDVYQESALDRHVASYVDRTRKCAYVREAQKRTVEALNVINNLTDLTDVNSIPNAIEGIFEGLMLDTLDNKPKPFKDVAKNFINMLSDKADGKMGEHILMSGIPDLDRHTGGFNLTDLIVLAGLSGSGKTEEAILLMTSIAKSGGSQLIFSLEMSNMQVVERAVGMRAQVPISALRNPENLDEGGWQRVSQATGQLIQDNMFLFDQTGLTVRNIIAMTKAHKARHPDLNFIVVDHVGLMDLEGNGQHHMQVGDISKRLKMLAKEIKVPVLMLSQVVGKQIMQRPVKDRIPNAQDVKDSSRIEEDADLILFTHRQETHDDQAPKFAELVFGKARHAIKGTKIYSSFVNGHFTPTDQANAHNAMDQYYNAQPIKSAKNF